MRISNAVTSTPLMISHNSNTQSSVDCVRVAILVRYKCELGSTFAHVTSRVHDLADFICLSGMLLRQQLANQLDPLLARTRIASTAKVNNCIYLSSGQHQI